MNTYIIWFIEDESNYTYVYKGISLYIYIYIYHIIKISYVEMSGF